MRASGTEEGSAEGGGRKETKKKKTPTFISSSRRDGTPPRRAAHGARCKREGSASGPDALGLQRRVVLGLRPQVVELHLADGEEGRGPARVRLAARRPELVPDLPADERPPVGRRQPAALDRGRRRQRRGPPAQRGRASGGFRRGVVGCGRRGRAPLTARRRARKRARARRRCWLITAPSACFRPATAPASLFCLPKSRTLAPAQCAHLEVRPGGVGAGQGAQGPHILPTGSRNGD